MAKKCRSCGAWAEDHDKFCEHCGSRLTVSEDSVVPEVQPEIVEAEIIPPTVRYESPAADAREVRERLVGQKAEYYLPRFEKMETLNSFTDWNWAAFIFTTGWMMYRRMYGYGIAMWALTNLLNVISAPVLLCLLVYIGAGVLGNYLYMKDINNRTDKAMDMQPEEREIFIQKNSGTSWVPVIILFVISMIVSGLLG